MSHADYNTSYQNNWYFSFEKEADEVRLILGPQQKPPLTNLTTFALTISDEQSSDQTARKPLPEHLMTPETATDIFMKAVGQFVDRQGNPLKELSKFPHLPVKVTDNSRSMGYKQALIAQHIK